jgi:hypothetical protein
MNRRHFLGLLTAGAAASAADVASATAFDPRYGKLLRAQRDIIHANNRWKISRNVEDRHTVRLLFNDMMFYAFEAFPNMEMTGDVAAKMRPVWENKINTLSEDDLRQYEDPILVTALARAAISQWFLPIDNLEKFDGRPNALSVFATRYRPFVLADENT